MSDPEIGTSLDRIADSLESIADSFGEWCKLNQARFDKDYPARKNPLDARITRVPTADDELRASQGETEETLQDWSTLGVREKDFVEQEKVPGRARTKK